MSSAANVSVSTDAPARASALTLAPPAPSASPAPRPKHFLTNEGDNTLAARLAKILPHTRDFACLVGYFFISGFHRLWPSLECVAKIRILIGLNNDAVVHGLSKIASDTDASAPLPSFPVIKATFRNLLKRELIEADGSADLETGIVKFVEWLRSGKLEVKLYRRQNIHAKVYVMTPPDERRVGDTHHGYVITGSSNFSYSGLEGNLEFNVLLAAPEDHDYALHRFNELWNDAADVSGVPETGELIQKIIGEESPFATFTPYELFLKFLAEYFRAWLGERELLVGNLPENFKKLQYQEDAVFTARQMLKAYGGVFISDVVGLGKTYISALLALQLDGRCLIIAPPSLLDENSPGSWPRVFRDFCVPGFRCVSIGKLDDLLTQDIDAYKYIIVDEAHRFKTDDNQRYSALSRICQGKGVILVSATPYNNSLDDIYSQIKLFQAPRASTIPGLPDIEKFFSFLRQRLNAFDRRTQREAYLATARENGKMLREKILKYLMIRRTRREIEEFYKEDLEKQKLFFPKISSPQKQFYQFNKTENAVFGETLAIIARQFNYARYQPLLPDYYKGPVAPARRQGAQNLSGFMRIMLMKRLESSFDAFQKSIERFITSHTLVLDTLDNKKVVLTSREHSERLFELLEGEADGDISEDDAADKIQRLVAEGKVQEYPASDFHPAYRDAVAADLALLLEIQKLWRQVRRDPKWLELKKLLSRKLAGQKIVLFTEFADTAKYIARQIADEKTIRAKALLYTSASPDETRRRVIANFDANHRSQEDDFQILVTTDVLAEGVNLHRSATVINYDIPWNPSRMMQRVGRVNRVGTKHKEVRLHNFFPAVEVNDEIELEEAAKAKIEEFISLLGNDAHLLTDEETIESHHLFDRINKNPGADDEEAPSELRYLRIILDVRDKTPALFERILRLPPKARSTRALSTTEAGTDPRAVRDGTSPPKSPSLECGGRGSEATGDTALSNLQMETALESGVAASLCRRTPKNAVLSLNGHTRLCPDDRPALITYFRQGGLDKFFAASNSTPGAVELDFFTTAAILETKPGEKNGPLDTDAFYALLKKNQDAFDTLLNPTVETLGDKAPAAKGGTEGYILKSMRDPAFRQFAESTTLGRRFYITARQILSEGRVAKKSLQKIKSVFETTDDHAARLAILRAELDGHYIPLAKKPAATTHAGGEAPREIVLSSLIPAEGKT